MSDATQCKHESYTAEVDVHRITDGDGGPVRSVVAEVQIRCAFCQLPFRFVGPPTGLAFSHPCVNVPGTKLLAPIEPGERAIDEVPSSLTFEALPFPRHD
jgi:hypothetical protein